MGERGIVPRKVKGFRDIDPVTSRLRRRLIEAATEVYRRYGFEHWDTPVLEYADALGKYLPDTDTADEGVYSFRNPEMEPVLDGRGQEVRDDANNVVMTHHVLAMRYDLTAPLARRYAEELWARDDIRSQQPSSPKPPLFRRYQYGPVFRFEAKLDPGRYREFQQLDFDTVGSTDVAVDAEACCVLSDALEATGLGRGTYEVRVNDRKLHKGLFERVGIADETKARDVLRVIDKYDKIGPSGVAAELQGGRIDPGSGAEVPGLGLPSGAASLVIDYVESCLGVEGRENVLARLESRLADTPSGREGLDEMRRIHALLAGLGYGDDRVVFDPSVARGLAYYTGPVFEAVSKLEVREPSGAVRRFGAICGGGRYDGLVERLLGLRVPATGASIGVDRLAELIARTSAAEAEARGPVLVVVMDPSRMADYQRIAAELRAAGIATEVWYGPQPKMKAQMTYADRKRCPVVVIAGGDEFAKDTVSIKDLLRGKELAGEIADRAEWLRRQPSQVEVARAAMVETVRSILAGGNA
ncbi:MAG: histidine--tRNA ligase [Deltaproteobacteria bacterium]|nr:histidine--tRNA ligase [Deltaproteobacteria bacterium]